MDVKRIDDPTLDDLNIEGGGDGDVLGFFEEAGRHYQDATRSTDQEAIEHIYGDGDWDDRAVAWVSLGSGESVGRCVCSGDTAGGWGLRGWRRAAAKRPPIAGGARRSRQAVRTPLGDCG